MVESLKNIFAIPDLRNRVLFTLAMLGVYRIANHIPTPGVNPEALALLAEQTKNTMFGLYDMFSGQNLSKMTIFALGIMPYISASIILQLLTVVAASSATVLDAVESNGRLIGQHFDATKINQLLNQKQVELLEQVSKTHANQIDQLGKITDIMSSANKMMEPVIVQRQEMLKKQDSTNQKLDELINAVQKSK